MPNVISCLLPGVDFDRAVEGLLGEADRVAKQLGLRHVAVTCSSSDVIQQYAASHSDRVVSVQSHDDLDYQPESCLAMLDAACAALEPRVVLLGQDTYSQELAPRLGYRLGGSSIGDAQQIDADGDRIRVHRSVYGGKATAVVQANVEPVVIWLRARAFSPEPERPNAAPVETEHFDLDGSGNANFQATQIVQRQHESAAGVRLEDAQAIVSGGRGLGGPEPFDELRKLAAVIGAELGASRAACDSGWVAPGLQVGQTGKKVAPELYLAVGISGASQHLMGIADAKVVAAINTDAEAPIFRHCQFGLVDDYRNVIGPLTERLVDLKSTSNE